MATNSQSFYRKIKPLLDADPDRTLNSPVRRIKPPKRKEPAELCTIATIMLRRNKDILTTEGLHYLSRSEERQLTDKEARKAIALIAMLKETV